MIEVLDEGTVVFEAKDGKYEPMKEENVMKLDISRRTGGATACSSILPLATNQIYFQNEEIINAHT